MPASTVPALLLAVVLVVSGIAKARDGESVTESFITLQLPPWLARSVAPALLPWGELVLAVALVVLGGWLGGLAAVAAVLLFAAYLWVIARALEFDHPVECGCLGRLGLGVVGPVTVVRNVLLLGLSVWTLIDQVVAGRSVLSRWLDAGSANWAWLGAVAVSVVTAGLMVYAGKDRTETTDAPAVAAAAPEAYAGEPGDDVETDPEDYERTPIPYLPLRRPDGTVVPMRTLAMDRARLLIMINPGCGSCVPVLDALPDFRRRVPQIGVHLMFFYPDAAENPYVTPDMLGDEWFVDEDSVVSMTLQLASPSAFLLGTDGYFAGGPVVGRDDVLEFFDDVAAALADAPVPTEPEAVPAVGDQA
ncbi:MauE/DoxX family redox-associated membrane protein [Ammonicoccus fulvus]|uniref:MauE/DoxX family redox-associated membrane protein n=1 Tax=Ammonicoccus fulvus TaxID=3138240 RepID=A0ABZ3FTH1_9ACTN